MTTERFRPTPEWPLQASYKEQLHNQNMKWGERVLPMIQEAEIDDAQREQQQGFLQWILEAVERGDRRTANLIPNFESQHLEATRSWYTDRLGSLGESTKTHQAQYDFMTLYAIFQAGAESV